MLQVSFGITALYSMYNMKREIDFEIFKITVNCLNNFIWELNELVKRNVKIGEISIHNFMFNTTDNNTFKTNL